LRGRYSVEVVLGRPGEGQLQIALHASLALAHGPEYPPQPAHDRRGWGERQGAEQPGHGPQRQILEPVRKLLPASASASLSSHPTGLRHLLLALTRFMFEASPNRPLAAVRDTISTFNRAGKGAAR
jgi:hypothetical protein